MLSEVAGMTGTRGGNDSGMTGRNQRNTHATMLLQIYNPIPNRIYYISIFSYDARNVPKSDIH